jgi:hypothetical protein
MSNIVPLPSFLRTEENFSSQIDAALESFPDMPPDDGLGKYVNELADRFELSTFTASAMVLRHVYGESDSEIAEDLDVPRDIADELAVAGLRQLTEYFARDRSHQPSLRLVSGTG